MSGERNWYVRTPLIQSLSFTKMLGINTYLKLENCQPSGTFKLRGIGALVFKAKQEGYKSIISSSGGNAGIAAAYSARKMGLEANVVVPKQTSDVVLCRLRDEKANVILYGNHWCEADQEARRAAEERKMFYVHPFDHPTICVGGGGLLSGVIQGLHKVGWQDVPVVAVETIGADCFNRSIQAGKRIEMPEITSMAKSLGANMVCEQAMIWYEKHPILSLVLPDKQAASACIKFADDNKMLVELACGASLAAIYDGHLSNLIHDKKLPHEGDVVVIVCGGNGVSLELVSEWKNTFKL